MGGYLSDTIAPVATWYGGFLIGLLGIFGFVILSKKQPVVQPAIITD
jgi:hypothetical protein